MKIQSFSRSAVSARGLKVVAAAALATWLAACSVEPPYHVPAAATPAAFKEAPAQSTAPQDAHDVGSWTPAHPADDAHRGQWWTVFGDPTLNSLEDQAQAANQNLKAAAARVQQARALTQAARASWFPSLDAGFGPTRERVSPASQFLPDNASIPSQTLWRAQGTVSYETDLFGRVSSNVNAARADAQQSEALFLSVQLALQADVAQNYFELRQFDSQLNLYQRTVALREDALKLVERRFSDGDISELDVAQARNELATAQADAVGVARQRAASEHGLAILLGKAPADFSFPQTPLVPVSARIPAGLPSTLLERRPDIAAAERAMAAANARVGLAKSAFFPKLDITGSFGYESATLGDLFMWSTRTFLLGPFAGTALTVPIFDGGRRRGALNQARGKYDEDVAQYRQQVLVAFREVEDNLSDLRLLDDQIRDQDTAVNASQRAAHLSQTQYQEGQIAYLNVIDSERAVLASQLQESQLQGLQAVATVNLIRALGGGWGDLPAEQPPAPLAAR
ncbi:MAG TPA: efflux transporter outer membrane subunit [Paraburkholderia sp.]